MVEVGGAGDRPAGRRGREGSRPLAALPRVRLLPHRRAGESVFSAAGGSSANPGASATAPPARASHACPRPSPRRTAALRAAAPVPARLHRHVAHLELVLPALERHHDVLALTLAGHAGGPPIEGEITDAGARRRGRARDGRGGCGDGTSGGQLAWRSRGAAARRAWACADGRGAGPGRRMSARRQVRPGHARPSVDDARAAEERRATRGGAPGHPGGPAPRDAVPRDELRAPSGRAARPPDARRRELPRGVRPAGHPPRDGTADPRLHLRRSGGSGSAVRPGSSGAPSIPGVREHPSLRDRAATARTTGGRSRRRPPRPPAGGRRSRTRRCDAPGRRRRGRR